MKKIRSFITLALALTFVMTLLGPALAQDNSVTFLSTQFNIVEEAEKAQNIMNDAEGVTIEYSGLEEGPLLDKLRVAAETEESQGDLVGALHGTFPTMVQEDMLLDLTPLLEELEADLELPSAFVELGKMGSDNYQYYIPWMQATYVMAANVEAMQYLPEDVAYDPENPSQLYITWEQLAQWAANMEAGEGKKLLGLPVGGLIHRFLQGYLYPSFTGGMVTGFKTEEAVEMWTFFRDELWPHVNEQSITYEFMQEPLLAGEVWVAFDHTARLKDAFEQQPDNFVAFAAPAGPAGRGFMPVLVGLGIPYTSSNPDGAEDAIRFLMDPNTQGRVLADLGFFPVTGGVDTSEMPTYVQIEEAAVNAQANAEDAIPALLPVGLGDYGGPFSQIYKDTLFRILVDGDDIAAVLAEQGELLQTLMNDAGAPCWPPDAPSEGPCQLK
ncbi:MAG: carbohydrate ABC transporter substrate-binding protein [Anaerolineales bacterium]|nr:carbohydrate ABC transporter substrate-binding protein [Anaerolineales bacterium]